MVLFLDSNRLYTISQKYIKISLSHTNPFATISKDQKQLVQDDLSYLSTLKLQGKATTGRNVDYPSLSLKGNEISEPYLN